MALFLSFPPPPSVGTHAEYHIYADSLHPASIEGAPQVADRGMKPGNGWLDGNDIPPMDPLPLLPCRKGLFAKDEVNLKTNLGIQAVDQFPGYLRD